MIKRLFDLIIAIIGLILLLPLFIIISLFVLMGSKGGIFFVQERIGKGEKGFRMLKFRTMRVDSESEGLLTIGSKDDRITPIGSFLRRYKLDELPQLINILKGEMSLVGPRPEVRKYVDLYTEEQRHVLNVLPGITDYASIKFANENELLATFDDPEQAYIKEIMPQKLAINLQYIKQQGFFFDLKLIFMTLGHIMK